MLRRLFAAAALSTLTSCGGDMRMGSSTVEIFSWWVAPGEREALSSLITRHGQSEPNVTIVNAAATDSATARSRLATRLQQGMPPDVFQANMGADLLAHVLVNGINDNDSRLEPLETLLPELRTSFPQRVIDALSVNNHVYGLPLNIHRINVLFFNAQVLATAGVQPPTTLAELETVCTRIATTGTPCFAMPARDGWTINLTVLEAILVGQAGADFYEQFLTGRGDPNDPRVRAAADTFLRLLSMHSASDSATLSWDQAVARVADGRAAFTVMGDWAKGFMTARGLTAGTNFGSVPFPGTRGTFVFTADAFVLPRGAPNRAGALSFLRTCASREGQVAFNLIKGSVPARTDADTAMFDTLGRQTIADLASDRLVSAASGLTPPAWADPVGMAAVEMVQRRDPSVYINTMVAYYNTLRGTR